MLDAKTLQKHNKEFMEIVDTAPEEMRDMIYYVYRFNDSEIMIEDKNLNESFKNILKAMISVDRSFFADSRDCYEDSALSIGRRQTISQPSTVARMLLLSELYSGASVLEVGTGSGWNAAILAYLVKPGKVVTTERIDELSKKAVKNISQLEKHLSEHLTNLSIVTEDALDEKGTIWMQTYNRILFTAGISDEGTDKTVEKMADKLLKRNGILVCPQASGPIIIYKKEEASLKRFRTKQDYVFVPLVQGRA